MGLVERIRSLCKERDITINILEQQVDGITRGSIAKWDDHAPALSKVQAVAKFFGMSLDEFLGEETKKDPSTMSRGEISEELFDLAKELQENYDLRRILFSMRGEDPKDVKNVADMLEGFRKGRED